MATAVPAMSKRSRADQPADRAVRDGVAQGEPRPGTDALDQRAWESKAWAAGRPKKTQDHAGVPGEVLERGWFTELRELGIDVDRCGPKPRCRCRGCRSADVDPDEVAGRAVRWSPPGRGAGRRGTCTSCGARSRRSSRTGTWSVKPRDAHGVRGGRHRAGPEHVHLGAGQPGRARARPALTSAPVVELEEDLRGRLGVAGGATPSGGCPGPIRRAQELGGRALLPGQAEAVRRSPGPGSWW